MLYYSEPSPDPFGGVDNLGRPLKAFPWYRVAMGARTYFDFMSQSVALRVATQMNLDVDTTGGRVFN